MLGLLHPRCRTRILNGSTGCGKEAAIVGRTKAVDDCGKDFRVPSDRENETHSALLRANKDGLQLQR